MKKPNDVLQEHGRRRREFIAKTAKVAAAAPAVALLVSQASMAQPLLSGEDSTAEP